jgi:hypothetical protein
VKKILFLFLFLFPPLVNAQTITYSGTNVGIGSTVPGQVLDVNGTSRSIAFNVNGYPGVLGSWQAKSSGTVYQAATDGFVISHIYDLSTASNQDIFTDGNNPPTTARAVNEAYTSQDQTTSCLVRKGDYWEVDVTSGTTSSVYFISIGA